MAEHPLTLTRLAAMPKLGLKGPAATDWLAARGLDVPTAIYDAMSLTSGGLIVRIAPTEFVLESGSEESVVQRLAEQLRSTAVGVYPVPREEMTFRLSGTQCLAVFAQACAVDFRSAPPHRIIYTRVAGVSCGILPEANVNPPAYRIWIEPSFALYLWETLAEIVTEQGGVLCPSERLLC